MEEPVFATLQVHPSALMRTVDVGVAHGKYTFAFVWPEGTLRAHGQLMSDGNTTGGTHNPIPAIALVELGTFCRTVFRAVAIEHNHGVANLLHAVGTHFAYRQDGIELTT